MGRLRGGDDASVRTIPGHREIGHLKLRSPGGTWVQGSY